ncbi:MAG: lysozyme [Lactobacillus sp.]|nr:lysozyme [Lactobacillus sp.]
MRRSRYRHKSTLPALLGTLLLVLAGIFYGLHNIHAKTTQPVGCDNAILGIKLTQKTSFVDLHKLKKAGISFIYLNATQGRSYFDDKYLTYRSQVIGTNLAFGTIVSYSYQSTPLQHFNYLKKMTDLDTGTLPILIENTKKPDLAYVKSMAKFVYLLAINNKKAMVQVSRKYRKYFVKGTEFCGTGTKANSRFWRYTTNGRVKNISELDDGVTMYAYLGTVLKYRQEYGELTQ